MADNRLIFCIKLAWSVGSALVIREGEHYSCVMTTPPWNMTLSYPLAIGGGISMYVYEEAWRHEKDATSGIRTTKTGQEQTCQWEIYDHIIVKCSKAQKVSGLGRCACIIMEVPKRVKEGSVQVMVVASLQGYNPKIAIKVYSPNQNWTMYTTCHVWNQHGFCPHSKGGNLCLSPVHREFTTHCKGITNITV